MPDNERWAHDEPVPEFEIDAQPVHGRSSPNSSKTAATTSATGGATPAGAGSSASERRAPRYVEQLGRAVLAQRGGDCSVCRPAQAVAHVSWYEADAWCRWAVASPAHRGGVGDRRQRRRIARLRLGRCARVGGRPRAPLERRCAVGRAAVGVRRAAGAVAIAASHARRVGDDRAAPQASEGALLLQPRARRVRSSAFAAARSEDATPPCGNGTSRLSLGSCDSLALPALPCLMRPLFSTERHADACRPHRPWRRAPIALSCVQRSARPHRRRPAAATPRPSSSPDRLRAQRVLDAPLCDRRRRAQTLRAGGPMVNLSEALHACPGSPWPTATTTRRTCRSARAASARAPASACAACACTPTASRPRMPDGQGQVAHFDLAGASRIEVLRGPFSVLYGNSSGGVIALGQRARRASACVELGADVGSFGLRQWRVGAGGAAAATAGTCVRRRRASRSTASARTARRERKLGNLRLGLARRRRQRDRADAQLARPARAGSARPDARAVRCRPVPDHAAGDAVRHAQDRHARRRSARNWQHRFGDEPGPLQRQRRSLPTAASAASTQWLAIPPATQANPRHRRRRDRLRPRLRRRRRAR